MMESLKLCMHCGFTWSEFKARGLLGCSYCYTSFADELKPILLEIHGVLPQENASILLPETVQQRLEEMAALREKLNTAIRDENYLEAQRLKQSLAEWEKKHESAAE